MKIEYGQNGEDNFTAYGSVNRLARTDLCNCSDCGPGDGGPRGEGGWSAH